MGSSSFLTLYNPKVKLIFTLIHSISHPSNSTDRHFKLSRGILRAIASWLINGTRNFAIFLSSNVLLLMFLVVVMMMVTRQMEEMMVVVMMFLAQVRTILQKLLQLLAICWRLCWHFFFIFTQIFKSGKISWVNLIKNLSRWWRNFEDDVFSFAR